ncbi:9501_t:CDS:1, partial [Paraglomus occultum]
DILLSSLKHLKSCPVGENSVEPVATDMFEPIQDEQEYSL